MGQATAQFPTAIWDGSSASRDDVSKDQSPDFRDWDQIVAEVKAMQEAMDKAAADTDGDNLLTVPNGSGGALVVGTPVYMLADGTGAQKADCNGAAPARNVCGLLKVGRSGSGGNVTLQQEGDMTLTTAEWDAITGDTGGLVPFTEYYLSATAGGLTATVPATTGDNVVVVGIAKSATVLNIHIRHSRISA